MDHYVCFSFLFNSLHTHTQSLFQGLPSLFQPVNTCKMTLPFSDYEYMQDNGRQLWHPFSIYFFIELSGSQCVGLFYVEVSLMTRPKSVCFSLITNRILMRIGHKVFNNPRRRLLCAGVSTCRRDIVRHKLPSP